MAEIDPVILELRANLSRYRNELRSTTTIVERSLGQQERSVLALESQFRRSNGIIGGSLKSLGGLAAGVGLLALAKQGIALADSAKQIDAQLRLATNTLGTFAQGQADAQRIAAETRTGLTETAKVYGNLVRATAALGGTQADASRATETFTKALKIGGPSTQEAASATLQFGQALASGVLRGEEFNSIAEASPRILQLLADSIGVPRGQLRALAEDGKLTSDVLFRALTDRKFTDSIDQEFKTLPITFSEAMQQVENAAITTFGAFDRGGGFSTALANFIKDGADGLDDLAQSAEDLGIEVRSVMAGLGDVFDPMLEGARSVFDQIGIAAGSAREDITQILGLIDSFANLGNPFENGIRRGANALVRGGVLGEGYRSGPDDFAKDSDLAGAFNRGADRSRANSERRLVDGRNKGLFDQPARQRASTAAASGASGKSAEAARKKAAREAEAAAKQAAREAEEAAQNEAQFQDDMGRVRVGLLRAQANLSGLAEDRVASELVEVNERQASFERRIALDKTLTGKQRGLLIQAEREIVSRERTAIEQAEQSERAQERSRIAENVLRAESDALSESLILARTAEDRKRIELAILDALKKEEKLALERVLAASRDPVELASARQGLDTLDARYGVRSRVVAQGNEGPLARYKRELEDIDTTLEGLEVSALRRLNDEMANSVVKAIGLKGALGDIVGELIRIGIQRQLIGPAADFLFGADAGGGGGAIGGFLKNAFGRASGGYVSPGQMYRVNEGATPGRVEGFRPAGSGTIVPLGQMNVAPQSAARQPVIVQLVVDEGGTFVTRVQAISGDVSVRQIAQAGPQIAGAAVSETFRQINRSRL